MAKTLIHFGNVEHRDVHNIYGMLMHEASFNGLVERDDGRRRPFVLTRSFFAGSQVSNKQDVVESRSLALIRRRCGALSANGCRVDRRQ